MKKKIRTISFLFCVLLIISCSESKTTREDLGQHFFETLQDLDKGEPQFNLRRGSIEELRAFSKIDTLPTVAITLDKIFNMSSDEYLGIVSYDRLISLKEEYEIDNWESIEYVDSKQKYVIDEPIHGEKYGDDIPFTTVTLIFKYNSKKYSIEGKYFENKNGFHLLTINPRLKELN